MNRPPRSLQTRLLVLVLGLVTGAWLVAAAVTWFDVRHELDELLDSHLAQAAALLVVQQGPEPGDDRETADTPLLHRYATKVAFQVFHEGRLVLRSPNAPAQPMAWARDGFDSGFRTVQLQGRAWRVFTARGAQRDVQVYVGEQVQSRTDILLAVLRSTLWPLAVALPLLALAVGWAVYRGVAPLRHLGGLLAARRPQALEPVTVDGAPAELQPVIESLNGLLARVAALLASERRFTADAAHELRTPLAAIRTQAQVALAEPDAALRLHALQSTVQGCDRATRVVSQLLVLSRLEAQAAVAPARVDLAERARHVLADVAPLALGKQQVLALQADGVFPVAGDATLIELLLRNLVDNAIRYSPRQARIQVTVSQVAGQVHLSVEDGGPGLDEAQLSRLGERFFRVVGTGEAGSGLGWSIVRRIAAAHGAQVLPGRSAALGGLSVQVIWPQTDTSA